MRRDRRWAGWVAGGRTTAVLGWALLVLGAACSDAGPTTAEGMTSLPTLPPQTSTTGPFDLPEVIDAAYVERVLNGLNEVEGDVLRILMESRSYTEEADGRLRAIYDNDDSFDNAVAAYIEDLQEQFLGIKPGPGNIRIQVLEILSTEDSCVFVEVEKNLSDTALDPITLDNWIAIVPLEASKDPFGLNPTGWAYIYNGSSGGERPAIDPCEFRR